MVLAVETPHAAGRVARSVTVPGGAAPGVAGLGLSPPTHRQVPWKDTMKKTRNLLVPLLGVALLMTACGGDDDATHTTDDTGTTVTTTDTGASTTGPSTTGAPAGETFEVTGVDYAFEGVPETMPAGSELTFTNASSVEAHELVAIRIPDEETRPVSELIELPDEELATIFPPDAPPAMVLIAGPNSDGMAVVGDGTIGEPGRYAVVCFIPVGADPEAVMNPDSTTPPDVEPGPPHAFSGMYAELIVE